MSTTDVRSTIGTSRNPLSAWHGERAIKAAAFADVRQQYPRRPDDILTALLAIRLYCEREGEDFEALVAGLPAITR